MRHWIFYDTLLLLNAGVYLLGDVESVDSSLTKLVIGIDVFFLKRIGLAKDPIFSLLKSLVKWMRFEISF